MLTTADKVVIPIAIAAGAYALRDSIDIGFMKSLSLLLLIASISWIVPIYMSVLTSRNKGISTAWSFIGIYPFAGWLVLLVVALLPPRVQCINCGGFIGANFVICPYCHCKVHG